MMSKVYTSVLDLIGHTPLLEPKKFGADKNLAARLLVKLESFNPAGSAKDRIAKAMIEDAEKRGTLKPGGTIVLMGVICLVGILIAKSIVEKATLKKNT